MANEQAQKQEEKIRDTIHLQFHHAETANASPGKLESDVKSIHV